jgi:exopolyphosphatase/guanosine-5'-triphosphate,3'-diphosphate pyrophosphatase
MDAAIDDALDRLPERGIRAEAALNLIGIAGTFTTLAAMNKKLLRYSHGEVHGSRLTLEQVQGQTRALQERSLAERKRLAGLEEKRADVIFAGARLVEKILARFGAGAVIVSDQGVRYGLLYEAAQAR